MMTLGKKLGLGFTAILLLVVGMCGWSYFTSNQVLQASQTALNAQYTAKSAHDFSEQARQWVALIGTARTGHQQELQRLQSSLLRNQPPDNAFLPEGTDHLGTLLQSDSLNTLTAHIPDSQPLLAQLQEQHALLQQHGQSLQQTWKVRHEGLAPKLEELKRTLLSWSLKTANVVFIQSSASELVADELAETPFEEFLTSAEYHQFAPTYPALVKTFEKARVTNEKLYRAIYDLDDIILGGEWEKARRHYRDQFPPLTKSLLVDLDGLLSQENRILRLQNKGIKLLNGPLSQASDAAQRLMAQLELQIAEQAQRRQLEAARASEAVIVAGEAVGGQVVAMKRTNLIVTACIVVIALLLSFYLIRSTTRPLTKAVDMLHALEEGRLDQRLEIGSQDEFGRMAQAMNSFADTLQHQVLTAFQCLARGDFTFKAEGLIAQPLAEANVSLNRLMEQIDGAAQQVNLGSNQISATSQTLSMGATEQARSIEDINQLMEAISSRTSQNTERVTQVDRLTEQTRIAADHGRSQMAQMTAAMREINEAGDNISKIIKTIDEIAFQTNLLALNAAVEAARAGVHGKGFAVVAEEVRNLAARSAKAASETASLIEDAVTRAQRGTDIADRTATALDGIDQSVGDLGTLIADVSQTFVEQAAGIRQTHDRLQDISRVTEINTATSEEAAAAATELAGQAVNLHDLISKFTLDHPQVHFPTEGADQTIGYSDDSTDLTPVDPSSTDVA